MLVFQPIYFVASKAEYVEYATFNAPCTWAGILRYFCSTYFISDPKIMVDVNVRATYTGETFTCVEDAINNKVADVLNNFFNQVDIFLGKAEYYKGKKTMTWE